MPLFQISMAMLSIIGSLIAAYLSYKIFQYNRLNKAWLAVTAAFVLIIFRRAIGVITDFGVWLEAKQILKNTESVLLVIISILYIWGFWSMLKSFESFDIVEKKITAKIRKIKKS